MLFEMFLKKFILNRALTKFRMEINVETLRSKEEHEEMNQKMSKNHSEISRHHKYLSLQEFHDHMR